MIKRRKAMRTGKEDKVRNVYDRRGCVKERVYVTRNNLSQEKGAGRREETHKTVHIVTALFYLPDETGYCTNIFLYKQLKMIPYLLK
jgi:hypothetical protein